MIHVLSLTYTVHLIIFLRSHDSPCRRHPSDYSHCRHTVQLVRRTVRAHYCLTGNCSQVKQKKKKVRKKWLLSENDSRWFESKIQIVSSALPPLSSIAFLIVIFCLWLKRAFWSNETTESKRSLPFWNCKWTTCVGERRLIMCENRHNQRKLSSRLPHQSLLFVLSEPHSSIKKSSANPSSGDTRRRNSKVTLCR